LLLMGVSAACCCWAPPPIIAQDAGTDADPLVARSYVDQLTRFRTVVVPAGDKLTVTAGTLVVVRSGKLRVKGPAKGALIDLTKGTEIKTGGEVPLNHLILVPDSAGYRLEADTLAMVLTMGSHAATK